MDVCGSERRRPEGTQQDVGCRRGVQFAHNPVVPKKVPQKGYMKDTEVHSKFHLKISPSTLSQDEASVRKLSTITELLIRIVEPLVSGRPIPHASRMLSGTARCSSKRSNRFPQSGVDPVQLIPLYSKTTSTPGLIGPVG